jgi:ribosomal protein S18 acetylase RimI-like enzyme
MGQRVIARLRPAREDDVAFLRVAIFEAAYWRPGRSRLRPEEAVADPEIAHYVEGFGRAGDFGVIAEHDDEPVGAAWCRRFPADAPGYGFVDEATPEVSIAVLPEHRGGGIGTALLEALLGEARRRRIGRLCLSVERDNPAVALYERLGFEPLAEEENTLTMVRSP